MNSRNSIRNLSTFSENSQQRCMRVSCFVCCGQDEAAASHEFLSSTFIKESGSSFWYEKKRRRRRNAGQ